MLSIGLMSGTSMDGIDAALLETDGAHEVKERGHVSLSYPTIFKILLKSAEYTIRKCSGDLNKARKYYREYLPDYLRGDTNLTPFTLENKFVDFASYLRGANRTAEPISLDEIILHSTKLHVKLVQSLLAKTGYVPSQVDIIGYHGQTMFHRPSNKISVTVGEGQYLANQLKIPVVNEFRAKDIAAGGQGAPFAPLYHQALAVRDKMLPVMIINCGGIANVTWIKDADPLNLIGFDTGPGNGLIDKLIRQRSNGVEYMDRDGKYGLQGTVHESVLQTLYANSIHKEGNNYFAQIPPKSLDIGDMELIPELFKLSLEDASATLEAFTADTIVKSLELIGSQLPSHYVLAGGGWHNPVIRTQFDRRLQKKLGSEVSIHLADEIGWNSQAMEAQIFAYLAVRSLQDKFISVPGTTGVNEPLSGGCLYLPQGGPKLVAKF